MRLRGLLVIVGALLFASAGGAESPVEPAPQRLGRPVLQPPAAEGRQTTQEPSTTPPPGSRRLGRPVLAVPPTGAHEAPDKEAPRTPPPTAGGTGGAGSANRPR